MVNVVCLLLGADLVIDGNFKLLYITYAFSSVNKKKFKFNKQCSGAQSSFTQKLFHTKRYAIQLFLFYLLLIQPFYFQKRSTDPGVNTEIIKHVTSGCSKLRNTVNGTTKSLFHSRRPKQKEGTPTLASRQKVKLRWDTTIHTDKKLEHNKDKEWIFIHISVPADQHIEQMQDEKEGKCKD